MKELAGDAVFFSVPAEEYVEITYRKSLREQGKLHYICGKGQLIYEGHFDDIDMAMMMHSQANMPQKAVAIGSSSNGFVGPRSQRPPRRHQCPERGLPGPHGHQRPAGDVP